MHQSKILLVLTLFLITVVFYNVDAATTKQTMDGSVEMTVTYPDSVILGRDFTISTLVQNNGWEDKQDIKFILTSPDDSVLVNNGTLVINRLSTVGSYGGTQVISSLTAPLLLSRYGVPLGIKIVLCRSTEVTSPLTSNLTVPPRTRNKVSDPLLTFSLLAPSSAITDALKVW